MKPFVSSVQVMRKSSARLESDLLAVEEPLQVQIISHGTLTDLMVTMRTPGHDFELVTGFLFTEDIIESANQIRVIRYCENVPDEARGNVVKVTLADSVDFDPEANKRNYFMTSACGVCGKSSLDHLEISCGRIPQTDPFLATTIEQAVGALNEHQDVFTHTGGLHACAVVDREGTIKVVREDIGRHNALDKLIGAGLADGMIPFHQYGLILSGRTSFEMIQKAGRAGFSVVAAIGAPSNLAVELALRLDMALLGFVRKGNFNIYAGRNRITL